MESKGQIFSMLSMLLSYPDESLVEAMSEIRTSMGRHRAFPPATRAALIALIDRLASQSLLDLQENYVETFDRGRATSLYLFEHVHGESRDRGQAMVDLLAMYEAKGLFLGKGELPDYLPVFLEFLSQETPAKARELLIEIADINRHIATKLAEQGSDYFAVVAALLPLAGEVPLDIAAPAQVADSKIDGEALDREWQDRPVNFLGAQAPVSTQPQSVKFYDKRPPR